MSITLHIDIREQKIINFLNQRDIIKVPDGFVMITESLDIGDYIYKIKQDRDNETNRRLDDIILIIERKSLDDLASSIQSGRYREQKARLLASNKKVMYIIEGDLANWSSRFSRITRDTLESAIANCIYRDNIIVYRTSGLIETCNFLIKTYEKLAVQEDVQNTKIERNAKMDNTQTQNTQIDSLERDSKYTRTLSTVKKENLTPKRCYILQLCQIPKVSIAIAECISNKYSNMVLLTNALADPGIDGKLILENLMYTTLTGKSRKIGPSVSKTVYNYIVQ